MNFPLFDGLAASCHRSSRNPLIGFCLGLGLVAVASSGAHAQRAYVANSDSDTVSVINTLTNKVIATVPVAYQPSGVAVSPDRTKVYITTRNSVVSVINTASNTAVAPISVGFKPWGVSFTPDGTKAYVVNVNDGNGSISVIDTASSTVSSTISVGNWPWAVAFKPDGTTAYVTVDYSSNPPVLGNVLAINTATNAVVATIPVGIGPFAVVVAPDGKKAYVTNNSPSSSIGSVSVINTVTNSVVTSIPVGNTPWGLAITPDGSRVYVSNENPSGAGSVSVIDTFTNSVLATVPVGSYPTGVSITPQGDRVYVVNDLSQTVSVIATARNAVVATIPIGAGAASLGNFIADSVLSFPLTCTSAQCNTRYDVGAYTSGNNGTIITVLDHQMKQNLNGLWQYGKVKGTNSDGVIVAFNGEKASGTANKNDLMCIGYTSSEQPFRLKSFVTGSNIYNSAASGCNDSISSVSYASYDEHPGYDYVSSVGTPVRAAAAGVVVKNANGGRCINYSGCTCDGWGYIGIDHGNGYITQYEHLSLISVRAGEKVAKWQQIGLSGNSAPPACAPLGVGEHLHFEVLKLIPGKNIGDYSLPNYGVVDPYGWTGTGTDPLFMQHQFSPINLWLR